MQNDFLSDVAFYSQYSKETAGGRETWQDAVDRVLNMHIVKLSYQHKELIPTVRWAFSLVKEKRVFCSQRAMQFGGLPIIRNNMRIYNCTFSNCDRPRFFSETFWLLLSGCGTGFSIRKRHTDKLPLIIHPTKWKSRPIKTHVISDTIEGWANALWVLIESYCLQSYFDHWHDNEIEFDYSMIRAEGEPISSGGKSPGPEPLRKALDNIRGLLRDVSNTTQKLTPLNCFDICMYLSQAVLSGGVRRSASIALFDRDDKEMIESKHKDLWWDTDPQRAMANISVAIKTDGSELEEDVRQIIEYAKSYGEPGVTFFKSNEHGTNPCAEIGLMSTAIKKPNGDRVEYVSIDMLENEMEYRKKGYTYYSGWQACNLTEINMAKNDTVNKFFEACRAASIIGTLQASYTDQGYLMHASKAIIENEALLGVSLTGMCENELSFNPKVLREGAQIVNDVNQAWADNLDIKSASRTTCIKPSGNTSVIAGTSAGIHPNHSYKYIRTMRINKSNPIWLELSSKLPDACETDLMDDNTGVVSFACVAPSHSITKDNDTALNHLERVKVVYNNWIVPGSANTRVEGLTHNVSNTCVVRENEWSDVADYIYKNRDSLRGVALLPYSGDTVYKQAPYQKVIDDDTEARWNMLANLDTSKVNFNFKGSINPTLEPACVSGVCDI